MRIEKAKLAQQYSFSSAFLLLMILSFFDIYLASRAIPNYPAVTTYRIVVIIIGALLLGLSFASEQRALLFHIIFVSVFAAIRLDEVLHLLPRIHSPDILLSLFVFSNFLALFVLITFTNFTFSKIFALAFFIYAVVYEVLYFQKMGDLPPILFIMVLASTGAVAVISNLIRVEKKRKREISRLLEKEVNLRKSIALMKGRMLEQEKSFSLSMLTAGIAHELGNPLNYVQGNMYFINEYMNSLIKMIRRNSLAPAEKKRFDRICSNYQSIIQYAEIGLANIMQIIENMKKIYGNRRNTREHTNMKEMLSRMVDFFRISHKSDSYSIQIDIPQELYCELNQGEYYIVFSNLLVNAFESMDPIKEAGRIELRACAVEGGVEITVADNGRGIDPDQIERVFDPFFSTKRLDSNFGLGLALCKDIVEADGGEITIESIRGEGTAVHVFIQEQQRET